MNHHKSNNPVPNPTKDIAERHLWVELPSGDAPAYDGYDDGDPIRNKYAAVGAADSPLGLSDPLDLNR